MDKYEARAAYSLVSQAAQSLLSAGLHANHAGFPDKLRDSIEEAYAVVIDLKLDMAEELRGADADSNP